MSRKTPQKILVVDDDAAYLDLVEQFINDLDISDEVVKLQDGREALDYLSEDTDIDPSESMILLDLNMPGVDGWEFLDSMGNLHDKVKDISLIVVSSSDLEEDREKARQYTQVKDYIVKPLKKELIQEAVKKHFSQE